MTLPRVSAFFSNCLTYYFTCAPVKASATNENKKAGVPMEGEENRRFLCFAPLLIGNLLAVACLLVVWNANAVTNKNVTWAVLIVGIASGMSILCCALCFLICFGEGRVGMVQRICCCCCFVNRQKPTRYGQTALPKTLPSLAGLKTGEKAKAYGIQTVCPTPEFQYFGNSTPVLTTTTSSTTTRLPTSTDSLNESTKSQSQLSAFSVISTAPACSPTPARFNKPAIDVHRQENNLSFSPAPFTGAYMSTPRLDPSSPIIQFPPPIYGLIESCSSPSSLAALSSEIGLIRTNQPHRSARMNTNPQTTPYMYMYSGV